MDYHNPYLNPYEEFQRYNHAGEVLWATSSGGDDDDNSSGISADASGNVFVTGYFQSASITFGTTTLTNVNAVGNFDLFIVKFDPSGDVLWAKSEGGSGNEWGYGVLADGEHSKDKENKELLFRQKGNEFYLRVLNV